jgi:hypothetical protein
VARYIERESRFYREWAIAYPPTPASTRLIARALRRAGELAQGLAGSTIVRIDMRTRGGRTMIVTTEAERRYEVDNLIADSRLEGHELGPEFLALYERYVRAEISSDQLNALWGEQVAIFLAGCKRYGE